MENKVILKILGTQSPYCKKNNANPSYLISDGEQNILLDCGGGSHRFFDMQKISGLNVFISHLHRDHYSDLFNYMYTISVFKNRGIKVSPLNIYLPQRPEIIVKDFKQEKFNYANFLLEEVNKEYNIGNFKVSVCKVDHSLDMDCYAIKVSVYGKTIVYTGDMSYSSCDAVVEFSKWADILLCESSLLIEHGFPKISNHLTAYQAGEIAKKAQVKKLVLTHFWPEENVLKYKKEAEQVFNNVFIAKEEDEYLV